MAATKKTKPAADEAGAKATAVNVRALTGSLTNDRGYTLLRQLLGTLVLPADVSEELRSGAIGSAMAGLQGLAPRDELESMMVVQLLGTHNAAMECLRRATVDGQTFEGRDLNLKHAEKLLTVYTRQVEALDKHRGKGQQKITVEHVTVNAGGQAIVGNVEAGARGATASDGAASTAEQAALTHNPAPLAPPLDLAMPTTTKQKAPVR